MGWPKSSFGFFKLMWKNWMNFLTNPILAIAHKSSMTCVTLPWILLRLFPGFYFKTCPLALSWGTLLSPVSFFSLSGPCNPQVLLILGPIWPKESPGKETKCTKCSCSGAFASRVSWNSQVSPTSFTTEKTGVQVTCTMTSSDEKKVDQTLSLDLSGCPTSILSPISISVPNP